MLPEVEEYFKWMDGSNESYVAEEKANNDNPVPYWDEKWNAEQRAEYYAAEERRSLAVLKARQERREKRVVAMEGLKNSKDPVVRWLATDRVIQRDYTGYRDETLKALPMTREEIDTFGDRKGWCSDYSRMLDRADRQGVLPEPLPDLANIDALVRDLVGWYGGHERKFRSMIKKHMPEILESAAKMAAERAEAEAKAKAEEIPVPAEAPTVDTTPADVQPRRRTVPVRNSDGTFAGSVTVAA